MKNAIHRSIYKGSSELPFIYCNEMSEKQLKISFCAKNLSIPNQMYIECLKILGEMPIVGPIDNTLYVKENVDRKVRALFVKKAEPVVEVNEEKDLKKVINQIEEKLKLEFKVSKKRNEKKFFSQAKIEEWTKVVTEVNKNLQKAHSVDKKTGTECIDIDFFRHHKFEFDSEQKIPFLKMKRHPRYGMELYLEFPAKMETINNGVKSFVKTRFRLTADLNHLSNSQELQIYSTRLILSIFAKIKAGYFLKYVHKNNSIEFEDVEKLPIQKHFLIPTLYVYLEHFYQVNSISKGLYETIKSDLNTLTKFLYKLPRKLPIELSKLEHSVRFLEFDTLYADKFLEYLQTNKDSRSNELLSGTTKRNIFSNLGNLLNKIKKRRHDLIRMVYVNPFVGHDIKPSISKRHVTYSMEQMTSLEEKLIENEEHQLLLFVNLLFHTGIRPIEAQRLKVSHFDNLEEGLFLPGEITKNGMSRTLPINDYLKDMFEKLNLKAFPKENFIFSPNGGIGKESTGKNYFTLKFYEIRSKIEDFTPFHTLYSLRHTFAQEYLKQAKTDNKFEARAFELMEILGHAKFETTQKYLKGFGRDFAKSSTVKGIKHWKSV